MSKDKISDYSATANSNTDIGGINIDEGCAPSGINDAIRTLMKQIKDWQSGSQDVYIHPAGSASAPSVTATGDTNTGIFFPAADTIALTTGGTERARVDSSGNLGLGVTPLNAYTGSGFKAYELPKANIYSFDLGSRPIAGFSVNSYLNSSAVAKYIATGYATLYESDQGQHRFYTAASGTAGNAISFTQAMTLDASGNLGVGTTSPSYALHVQGASKSIYLNDTSSGLNLRLYNGTSSAGISGLTYVNQFISGSANALEMLTSGASPLVFGTTNTERARIDSSGNLLVGTTSAVNNGKISVSYNGSTNNGVVHTTTVNTTYDSNIFNNSSGTTVGYIRCTASATTYSTSSDYRLKENIAPMTGALATVAQLNPVTYNWKVDGSEGQGFIAHELQEVVPDCVTGEKDEVDANGNPKYQGIDTSFLVATLTAAIQELKAEFDAYKAAHP